MSSSHAWAIYGGRFDPFHHAHRELARRASEDLPIERVLVVPNGAPAHQEVEASWQERVAMCKLGVAGLAKVAVAAELELPGAPRRSYATIAKLRESVAVQVWVVGGDAFAALADWQHADELLDAVNWAVMPREGEVSWQPRGATIRAQALARRVNNCAQLADGQGKVWVWNTQLPKVSATDLRTCIRTGGDWQGQMPASVATHIVRRGLYGA